ncbi:hypothetical protein KIN_09530 [Litoreibacter roseus]|uniref:Uncharacterized protein n=1 Tax=Litoreibacter roseus TaxID=2601869 RepID=A0A6N6JET3_9RHOB|nr:hypothetical protein KIN_09530 [Litoreibacter roseus]
MVICGVHLLFAFNVDDAYILTYVDIDNILNSNIFVNEVSEDPRKETRCPTS